MVPRNRRSCRARTSAQCAIFAPQSSRDTKRPTQRAQSMFRILSISEQPPPGFAPDWLAGVRRSELGYLEPYRRLTLAEQANDLVLREATGDRYWLSEYEAKGRPVPFHCGLIIHFIEHGSGTTEVQVFEVVPTVWVGEHWAMSKEGPGSRQVSRHSFRRPHGEGSCGGFGFH